MGDEIRRYNVIISDVSVKSNCVFTSNELGFICLSGLATGASWLCYYWALQDGPASVIVPIDKLSILVTVVFSGLVFHEKLTRRAAAVLLAALLVWRRMEHKAPIKPNAKTIGAVLVGVLGALLLGVGMCLCLLDSAKMAIGVVAGVVGIVVLLMLIPLLKGIHE